MGDITTINEKDIPEHDILLAGFPCQPFSISGRKLGFSDTRGTLFFDIARIIKEKKPKAFFLENVKGLVNHDTGKTLKVILDVLRNDLNYYVPEPEVINANKFNVPQNRERIFIVGFRKDVENVEFTYPIGNTTNKRFIDVKEKNVPLKYYISETYLTTLKKHKKRHKDKGNGFGYKIINDDEMANTLVTGGMGRERNLVKDKILSNEQRFNHGTSKKGQLNSEGIRTMTPREWARLQGFPEDFKIVVSDTQAYKQFGNSVAVPAIKAVGFEMIKKITKN